MLKNDNIVFYLGNLCLAEDKYQFKFGIFIDEDTQYEFDCEMSDNFHPFVNAVLTKEQIQEISSILLDFLKENI